MTAGALCIGVVHDPGKFNFMAYLLWSLEIYEKKTTTFIDMNTLCRIDSLYHHIRPQKAHVLGEDLVPEQENKMEKAGRGNEVGPRLRLLICTVDLKKIQNADNTNTDNTKWRRQV